jgi:acyl-CoA synthetase (NDP forming)
MLNQYGFDMPRNGLTRDAEEAVQRAVSIGFSVAMKIVSPQILHKTDINGVVLGAARTRFVVMGIGLTQRQEGERAVHGFLLTISEC